MVLLFSISFVLANAPKAIELLGGVMLVGVWTMDLFGPSGRLQFSFSITSICDSMEGSENIRAYISRSFTNPMWHDILGNKHMQKAIVMAQICLYVVPCMKLVHGTLDLGNCTADFCRILTAEGFQMPSVLAAECRARG